MKSALSFLLLGSAIALGAAPAVAAGAPERTTAKPASEFVACFAGAQQRAAMPWSFVPRENGGGTFSNAGATGVASPYFLDVRDRGAKREIRLERGNAPSPFERAVMSAVDRCI